DNQDRDSETHIRRKTQILIPGLNEFGMVFHKTGFKRPMRKGNIANSSGIHKLPLISLPHFHLTVLFVILRHQIEFETMGYNLLDRKSTRLNSKSRENLVCGLLLEKK